MVCCAGTEVGSACSISERLREGISIYYTILYYTILYYTILYYNIIYYTILYYTILYYTILYYTILYYTILYYTIPYFTILYCTGSRCPEGRGHRSSGQGRNPAMATTPETYHVRPPDMHKLVHAMESYCVFRV